jgi:signal transduction histidine kinase
VVTASPELDPHVVLRLLPHGVLVVAPDWRVLYANPEACRLLGDRGATLWERCPELEHTAFASGFRYAMADRTELLSESALPAVGWCQARARPLPEGGLLISLRQVHAHTMETGQARHALLIGELGEALAREESLAAALARSARVIARHLDAALVRLWIVEDGAELALCARAGREPPRTPPRLRLGEGRLGQIAESGEPYLTNEVGADPVLGGAWAAREQLTAFAGYPLRIEDRIVGVLEIYSRRSIDHETLNALSSITNTLALGIERMGAEAARQRAEARLRKQAGHLEVLYILAQQLAAELDPDALAQKIADAGTRLAGAQVGAFFYTPAKSGDGYLHHALSGDAPLDAAARLAPPSEGRSFASYLTAPVVVRTGRRIGALAFGHERPGMFTSETTRLIANVAATAAIAMDNARLFEQVREHVGALEKTNRDLDQFAYVASHDLKAPLRGIGNLAQWIEEDLGDKMDARAREHMQLLRGRVVRLENLIGGILAYSRAGRDKGDLVEVDVRAIAAEAWELISPPPTAHLALPPELPRPVAPRTQFQQVLMNLFGNAVKYNEGREVHIEIGGRRDERGYEFFVRDDGVGIAPEYHDRIWGLFQTLERRDKMESTGIGLSVVRKIVESHGGHTWVQSQPGSGATFYFTWGVPSGGGPGTPAERADG